MNYEKSYYTIAGDSIGSGLGVSKMFKFYIKVCNVTGKVSCMGQVLLSFPPTARHRFKTTTRGSS